MERQARIEATSLEMMPVEVVALEVVPVEAMSFEVVPLGAMVLHGSSTVTALET